MAKRRIHLLNEEKKRDNLKRKRCKERDGKNFKAEE
jgi:hypothetical protein